MSFELFKDDLLYLTKQHQDDFYSFFKKFLQSNSNIIFCSTNPAIANYYLNFFENKISNFENIKVEKFFPNDFDVISGQGTIGLELARQAEAMEYPLDFVFGPSSGGGMMGGVALAFATLSPDTFLYSVEPSGYDDIAQSLTVGDRVTIEVGTPSLCDALLLETPGELTFEIMKSHLSGGVSVSDEQVLVAMRVAFDELKIVLEPSGATALAAALHGKIDVRGKTVGIICSGGNVDPDIFARALQS